MFSLRIFKYTLLVLGYPVHQPQLVAQKEIQEQRSKVREETSECKCTVWAQAEKISARQGIFQCERKVSSERILISERETLSNWKPTFLNKDGKENASKDLYLSQWLWNLCAHVAVLIHLCPHACRRCHSERGGDGRVVWGSVLPGVRSESLHRVHVQGHCFHHCGGGPFLQHLWEDQGAGWVVTYVTYTYSTLSLPINTLLCVCVF